MPTSTAGPDADVTVDAAGAAGTANTTARAGHGHRLVTSATTPASLADAGSAGTAGSAPSRGDHVHPATRQTGSITINNKGSASTSSAFCEWVQIGRLVVAHVGFAFSGAGSGSSTVTVDTDLPPPSGNARIWADRGGVGVVPIVGRFLSSGGHGQISVMDTLTAPTSHLTGADLASGASYSFHFAYISAA
jgi:hypothetical protein